MNYYPVEMIRIGYGRSNETSESRAAAVEPITITGALIIAVVLIIGAWGAAKVQDLQEQEVPPGADPDYDTRSDFEVCTDEAQERLDRCLRQKQGDFWGETGCWAAYSLKMGECIILPQ